MSKKSSKKKRAGGNGGSREREAERSNSMSDEERRAARAGMIRSTSSVLIVASALFIFTYLLPDVLHIDIRELGQNTAGDTTVLFTIVGIALILAPVAMIGSTIATYSKQGGDTRKAFQNLRRNILSKAGLPYVMMMVVGVIVLVWALAF